MYLSLFIFSVVSELRVYKCERRKWNLWKDAVPLDSERVREFIWWRRLIDISTQIETRSILDLSKQTSRL